MECHFMRGQDLVRKRKMTDLNMFSENDALLVGPGIVRLACAMTKYEKPMDGKSEPFDSLLEVDRARPGPARAKCIELFRA